jgi:RimJ/RimL family protein N-acetyltransferase
MGLPVYFAAERALRRSHPGVNRIVSRIHCANTASQRLHRDAGFEMLLSADHEDWLDAWKVLN